MWKRVEKALPVLSGEELVITNALKTKIEEVKKQLQALQKQRLVFGHSLPVQIKQILN